MLPSGRLYPAERLAEHGAVTVRGRRRRPLTDHGLHRRAALEVEVAVIASVIKDFVDQREPIGRSDRNDVSVHDEIRNAIISGGRRRHDPCRGRADAEGDGVAEPLFSGAALGSVALDAVCFLTPAKVGDTVTARLAVRKLSPSASGQSGRATVDDEVSNQTGAAVLGFRRTLALRPRAG